jgi:hypothetical protein
MSSDYYPVVGVQEENARNRLPLWPLCCESVSIGEGSSCEKDGIRSKKPLTAAGKACNHRSTFKPLCPHYDSRHLPRMPYHRLLPSRAVKYYGSNLSNPNSSRYLSCQLWKTLFTMVSRCCQTWVINNDFKPLDLPLGLLLVCSNSHTTVLSLHLILSNPWSHSTKLSLLYFYFVSFFPGVIRNPDPTQKSS